jgi:hypothetical protein
MWQIKIKVESIFEKYLFGGSSQHFFSKLQFRTPFQPDIDIGI